MADTLEAVVDPMEVWSAALADATAKRAAEAALPADAGRESDPIAEAAVTAEDHLIENVDAPTPGAVATKLILAMRRSAGSAGLYDDHVLTILYDLAELDLQFARAWLGEWKKLGGSVTRNGENSVWIGHPEYHCSPVMAEDEARMDAGGIPEGQRDFQRNWLRGFYSGKTRALNDMLDAMPGAIAALKSMVREDPTIGQPAHLLGDEGRAEVAE